MESENEQPNDWGLWRTALGKAIYGGIVCPPTALN
jgi:hypothetical protein